ncbi:FAD-dependent oxidoreductase [Poseidonibacter antarcticus]|uniref:FAD-dependent oxidoreductase n=1 Tax=Poseidonibacter antarcticus TaxID=2478538 RepID=UPI000EF495D3|nr:FAD-dependent oxidoreductase [Poseidonibacter antarcticus]
MTKQKEYEYIIIGAGVAGCSTAYFLSKYSKSILLIDKNENVSAGASGAAGAFLSPLLGKPNKFKDLISTALRFSTSFYKELNTESFKNEGVCRIPKNDDYREKFESYKPFMDFEYKILEDGYFFEVGSWVNPSEICDLLTQKINKKLNYNIDSIKRKDNIWILNDEIKTKNLILCTGANTKLIKEKYFDIRAVWGQKIDVLTSTNVKFNYHKECSVSKAVKTQKDNIYKVFIGATHHRFDSKEAYTQDIINEDSLKLIDLANDIIKLKDVNIIDIKLGARASSTDYFPMVGSLIDSKKSFEKFPHLINGTHIKDDMLEKIENLYVINGVGGRGFVLSPYLANELVENIINNKKIAETITTCRLFKRWAKKQKNK